MRHGGIRGNNSKACGFRLPASGCLPRFPLPAFSFRPPFQRFRIGVEQQAIAYAVCGGLAMAVHGFPRATVDIDLLVPDTHLEQALSCLKNLGYHHQSGWLALAQGGVRIFRVVKLDAAAGELARVWEQRQRQATPAGPVWVVSRTALAAMKRGRGNKQDLADIENLERLADED